MALSKPKYPITELDEARDCAMYYTYTEQEQDLKSINLTLESCLRIHRIGSFTVTRQEYQGIAKVALGHEDNLMTLSCRIRQVLRYFVQDPTKMKNHIFCRNSFGICATKFALIDRLISEKYGKDRDEYTQMVDFVEKPAPKKKSTTAPKKRVYKKKTQNGNNENVATVPVDLPHTSPISPAAPAVMESTPPPPPPTPVVAPLQYDLVENSSAVIFPVPPPEQVMSQLAEDIVPLAESHQINDIQASDIVNEAFNLAQHTSSTAPVTMSTTVATPIQAQPHLQPQEVIEVVLEESPTNSPRRIPSSTLPLQGDGLWLSGTASVSFFEDLEKKNNNLLLSTIVTMNNIMNSCDLLLPMRRNHAEIAAHQCRVMAIVSKIQSALVKYKEEFDSCRRESRGYENNKSPLLNAMSENLEEILKKTRCN